MVDVVCDTDFLIHLAKRRIRNIDRINTEIGQIEFVVPKVVKTELGRLLRNEKKAASARAALDYAKNLRTVPVSGEFADARIAEYARSNRCMVGTMDRALKRKIKLGGGSVVSFSNDSMVLEQDTRTAVSKYAGSKI